MTITRPDIDDLQNEEIISPGETLDNPFPSYANETERLAAIGFTVTDVGKPFVQRDDNSLWILTGYDPIVWQKITADGSGHARGHSLINPLDHTDVTGTPDDGDVLAYSSTSGKWEPTAAGSANFDSLLITTEGGIIYDLNGEFVLKG